MAQLWLRYRVQALARGAEADDDVYIVAVDWEAQLRLIAAGKPDRAIVRDEARKRAVIDNACRDAQDRSLPAEPIAQIWEMLVETSIDYELAEWDRIRA